MDPFQTPYVAPQVDPNAVANRILTLRQAMQGQQLQQQQIQAAQQENQMRAYQMDKIRALNNAYQAALKVDPTTGRATIDRDSMANALKQAGHGEAIPDIMKGLNDYELSDANLQAKRTEVAKAEVEHGGSLASMTRAGNNDPQLFLTLTTDAVRRKHVAPEIVQPMIDSVQKAMAADPSGAQARTLVGQYTSQMIAGSEKQRELDNAAKTADARAQASQTQADRLNIERPGLEAKAKTDAAVGAATLANPKLLTPDQQRQSDQANATLDETKKRDAQTARSENARNNIAAGELDIRRKTFDATIGSGLDANGKPLSDDELRQVAMRDPVAVAIANYQSPDANPRTALGKATMARVYVIDRNHDGTMFGARNKTAQDYSPAGASGKTFMSIDNGLAHVDMLSQAGKALDNNDLPTLNRIANELGYQFGGSAKNVYDGIVQIVAPELIKGSLGEAGGEGERGGMRHTLTSDTNTATREQTLGAIATIFGKRIDRMRSAYKQQMNREMPLQLSDDSKAVLQRYGGGGKGNSGPAQTTPYSVTSGGKTYYFKSQADLDGFKKEAGIK